MWVSALVYSFCWWGCLRKGESSKCAAADRGRELFHPGYLVASTKPKLILLPSSYACNTMPTLSIRVDDDTKAAIIEAAKEAGHKTYADFLRAVIGNALRADDTEKTNVVHGNTEVLRENTQLKTEVQLKDDLLAARAAHIADLEVQLGWFHQYALPEPKAEEQKEKKKWWPLLPFGKNRERK